MSEHRPPAVKVWGSGEAQGRREAAPIVARAFAKSPSVAMMTSASAIASAVILALMFKGSHVLAQLLVTLPLCYVLNVAALWVACRIVTGPPGSQWWIIEDARGRAAVFTKPIDGPTGAYNVGATPKRRGLAADLMPYVAARVAPPLRGTAFPSVARIYTTSGMATDCGPARWSMREVEFIPEQHPTEAS